MVARIAVSGLPYSVDRPFDYLIPEEKQQLARPGTRVIVPFSLRNERREGIILDLKEQSEYPDCKEILSFPDEEPLLTEQQLQLCFFMRDRYFCTVFEAVRAMTPAGFWMKADGKRRVNDSFTEVVRLCVPSEEAAELATQRRRSAPRQAELLELLSAFEELPTRELLQVAGAGRGSLKNLLSQGVAELGYRERLRRPEQPHSADRIPLPKLSEKQKEVFDQLAAEDEAQKPALLFGVTGSGKTSIYAALIEKVLSEGKSAILLVPEISLTPQMLASFSAWFGDVIALQHSGLSLGERYDEWKRIRRGEARLVIGTRSAIFSPLSHLGLIILDEEQEESYRSELSPRYHARDIALYRGKTEGASVLLGSATPDLRSFYYGMEGKYRLLRLPGRFNQKPLPKVHIVDMKEEIRQGNRGLLSAPLRDAVAQRLERGEQSILFLNRRGTSKLISCADCGFIYECSHCSVPMTWHADRKRLICHYCGSVRRIEERCPSCGGRLSFFGFGTQYVEQELQEAFPGIAVLRVDADSVQPSGSHEALFRRFTEEKIPIMIGTQMVSKGLNFDRVTLVGVLSADQSLYNSDYRAGERCFHLLTQVVGRCGRGELPGEAIIQTLTPDNEVIRLAARQDYEAFYGSEIETRRLQEAPPFSDRVCLTASGREEEKVKAAIENVAAEFSRYAAGLHYRVDGPVPLSVVRLNDQYRYRLQLLCRYDVGMRRALESLLLAVSGKGALRGIRLYVELDPGN